MAEILNHMTKWTKWCEGYDDSLRDAGVAPIRDEIHKFISFVGVDLVVGYIPPHLLNYIYMVLMPEKGPISTKIASDIFQLLARKGK